MEIYELPLVFFTVLVQWGIGGVIALTLCQSGRSPVFETTKVRKISLALWVITLVGSFASLAHLGTPLGAYRAFLGLGRSWLSREVVAFMLLNSVMAIWLMLCWFTTDAVWKKALGWGVSLVGLGAILVTSQVYYQIKLHPLWNTIATPTAFFGSALLLGFVSIVLVANYWQLRLPGRVKVGMLTGIAFVVLALWLRSRIPGADGSSPLLWWQLLASLTLSAWMFSRADGKKISLASCVMIIGLIVSGELAGRMLFYSNVMSGAPWF